MKAPVAVLVKVEQIGDDLAIVLLEEVLAHLKANVGDTLELVMTPNGILLKAHDAQFEAKMAAIRQVMEEHKDVLRMLAD
jgi:putative addiction module antidote